MVGTMRQIFEAVEMKESPYGRNCPACGAPIEGTCRCRGPHTLDQLRAGHGDVCANGHRSDPDLWAAIDARTGAEVQTEARADLVPPEVLRALRPHAKRVRDAIRSWNMGDPSDMTDDRVVADVWDTAKAAGWKADELVDQPREAVLDVLAIWRDK